MQKSTSDVFQIGLLLLVTVVLSANAFLFLRLQETQNQILREIRRVGSATSAEAEPTGLPPGTTAPDFRLDSLAEGTVSLGDFGGEPVLLIFSSTTCPACDYAYPYIREFHDRSEAPEIVMISRGSTEENQRLATEKALRMPILEWSHDVAQAYQVPGTPFGVLVDGEGRVARTGVVTQKFLDTLGS